MAEITEIQINEHGDETHESWLLIRANRVSGLGGRAHLFDSEVAHQHWVVVTITRCTRQRDLNHDRLHGTEQLVEVEMSQAQWGAFVSSFGSSGVPATLSWLGGPVAQAPSESRFDQSHEEVLQSGEKALAYIVKCEQAVQAAFEGGGRKALREALRDLHYAIENAPKNMEFAAKSLTEHVENVVTKARADIEGMALAAAERGELAEPVIRSQLGSGADR